MNSTKPFIGLTLALACALAAPASAGSIVLVNGDRLSGTILSETDDKVTLQHPVLGKLTLPRAEIASLEADDADNEQPATAETAAADSGLLGTGWLSDWQRKVSFGIAGTSGKSDDQKINASFTAGFEDETTRWSHETSYYRNEADGALSDNSLKSLLNRDWLQPGSPWFHFAGGRFDWDEFQDWDYRITGNAGVGYEFIRTDRYRLLGRAGLGANQTFGDREELTLEGLIGIDATWRISAAQKLAFTNRFHPNLEQSGEYRNLTTLDWTLDLDKESGLGLKVSLSNDYDSLADEATDKNDFKYAGSLVWEL